MREWVFGVHAPATELAHDGLWGLLLAYALAHIHLKTFCCDMLTAHIYRGFAYSQATFLLSLESDGVAIHIAAAVLNHLAVHYRGA